MVSVVIWTDRSLQDGMNKIELYIGLAVPAGCHHWNFSKLDRSDDNCRSKACPVLWRRGAHSILRLRGIDPILRWWRIDTILRCWGVHPILILTRSKSP